MELDVTKKVAAAFEREGVRYIIIGGIALNLLSCAKASTWRTTDAGPEIS